MRVIFFELSTIRSNIDNTGYAQRMTDPKTWGLFRLQVCILVIIILNIMKTIAPAWQYPVSLKGLLWSHKLWDLCLPVAWLRSL